MAVEGKQEENGYAELDTAEQEAYSLRDNNTYGMEYVGEKMRKGRLFTYWKDRKGRYWYTTSFGVKGKWVPEEVYIFGRMLPEKKKNVIDTMRQQLEKG